jgi:hypothetical protein
MEIERQTTGSMLVGRDNANGQVCIWGFGADQQSLARVEVDERFAK